MHLYAALSFFDITHKDAITTSGPDAWIFTQLCLVLPGPLAKVLMDVHFHTESLLHPEEFTHRTLYTRKLPHTEAATHGGFYTQTLLHTELFNTNTLTNKSFDTQELLLHTDALAHTNFHTIFTHRHLYTHTLLRREHFDKRLSRTEASSHKHFHTQKLFQTDAYTQTRLKIEGRETKIARRQKSEQECEDVRVWRKCHVNMRKIDEEGKRKCKHVKIRDVKTWRCDFEMRRFDDKNISRSEDVKMKMWGYEDNKKDVTMWKCLIGPRY